MYVSGGEVAEKMETWYDILIKKQRNADFMLKRSVIGILAHVDAGKTTLSEAMLYTAARLRTMHVMELLELLRQLRSKGMTAQIGEIRFEESGIVLRYQDRLDVYLDREDDFAYRLRYLAAVLEKLEENETGTIRWDAEGSARFIPG